MAGEKIKLQEDAISEIVVADSDWESDAEASNVDYFEEEEKEEEDEEREEEEGKNEEEEEERR